MARLGVVVPHADVGPEAELQAMAPATMSIHAARLPFAAPLDVFDWVCAIAAGADSVFIAGNGLRAVGAIAAPEDALGIPVVTANQVLLWQTMQLTGVTTPVDGYGHLFRINSST